MNLRFFHCGRQAAHTSGMTLVEVMMSLSLGLLVLTMLTVLYVFGLRAFTGMNNYSDMDAKSRLSLDLMLREIRQSSHVVGWQSNATTVWLKVGNVVASPAVTNTFTWQSSTRILVWDKTASGQTTRRTLLNGCDRWGFWFYLRAPDANGNFIPTSNPNYCKLIAMSWACSRTNLISGLNSEGMVTAQVVLRNLQL